MNRRLILLLVCLCIATHISAQVGVNNDNSDPDASAMLDVKSTNKGMLIPRMTTAQRNLISNPALGLLVFDTDTESFWFKETSGWVELGGSSPSDEITDADGDTKIQVEESADEDKIRFDMDSTEYFVMERGRIHVKNTGRSIFLGDSAGVNDNLSNNNSIFIGHKAGKSNFNGGGNTALGFQTLNENQNGDQNTAVGYRALEKNSQSSNTAIGAFSLSKNSTGFYNTAIGQRALEDNINGDQNVAIGINAGENNNGSLNLFLGSQAGRYSSGDHKLYIENSNADSANALIYGQFDNDFLRLNANTLIRDTLILPTGAANGLVLTSDANGKASWAPSVGGSSDMIQDADNDTKIQVEASSDDDKIRFAMEGVEYFVMDSGRIEVKNTGGSIFIGDSAGVNSTLFNQRNIFIGDQAGYTNYGGFNNIALGFHSLRENTFASNNTAIGYRAMRHNTNGGSNAAIGHEALYNNIWSSHNSAMGFHSLYNMTSGANNVAIGSESGSNTNLGIGNVFLGKDAGRGDSLQDRTFNVMVGSQSGYDNSGNYNVFLGYNSGYYEPGDHKLYIENSDADSANSLVYGEFDNDFLRLNANTLIRDTLILPTGAGDGYFLRSDANGKASWVSSVTSTTTILEDSDNDTKIQVEESADEDKIRFAMGGIEYFVMDSGRIQVNNTGGSVFMGDSAGVNDDLGDNENVFLGEYAGFTNVDGYHNIAIGKDAYMSASGGHSNIAIGDDALQNNNNTSRNVAIGSRALRDNLDGYQNVAIGANALQTSIHGGRNVAIGQNALRNDTIGNDNAVVGEGAMFYHESGNANSVLGKGALRLNKSGSFNATLGIRAGEFIENGSNNTLLGGFAGRGISAHDKNNNVMIGYESGNNNESDANIFLGYQSGYNETGANRLYIENSDADSDSALIYGEFDNDFLRLNANTLIRDTLILPTGAANGLVLTSDANGKASWAPSAGGSSDMIHDDDNDTKIQVEESVDEDIIRFDLGGNERLVLNTTAHGHTNLSFPNTNSSILIGNSVGDSLPFSVSNNTFIGDRVGHNLTDGGNSIMIGNRVAENSTLFTYNNVYLGSYVAQNLNGHDNVVLGFDALTNSTGGHYNVVIGKGAGENKTSGSSNVLLGNDAGKNSGGSHKNVFIGNQAGQDETKSNRLYIETSDADANNALIYGEFATDFLRLNANTLIRDTLILPTGAANGLVLTSDANGKAFWAPSVGGSSDMIHDADNDTKIQVEESADEDMIRFDMGGIEYFVMDSGRIHVRNTGNSIFLGQNAGLNDDLTNNRNVFIGNDAGKLNTSGVDNHAIGYEALRDNETGAGNTAIGRAALVVNTSGGNNIALGRNAQFRNKTGDSNISLGLGSLQQNVNGSNNIILGTLAGNGDSLHSKYENVMIGPFAGNHNEGDKNLMIGFQSGQNNEGNSNVFLGHRSGFNAIGSSKLYIENSDSDSANALIFGQFNNDFLRLNANTLIRDTLILDNGRIRINNTGGSVFLGDNAGINDDLTDNRNTFIGFKAGLENITGEKNTALGNSAGYHMTGGNDNVLLGYNAGYGSASHTKERNVMLGVGAGRFNEGSDNIFVGFNAGRNESGSEKLYIENSATDSANALIFGQFNNDFLRLNANTLIRDSLFLPNGAITGTLDLNGEGNGNTYFPVTITNHDISLNRVNGLKITAGQNIHSSNSRMISFTRPDGTEIGSVRQTANNSITYATSSDIRLKEKIVPTTYGLSDLMQIKVADYYFKGDPQRLRTGFIAQQLYEYYPEAVTQGGDDTTTDPWMVDYGQVTPLLVKAVQEQQAILQQKEAEILELKASLEEILKRLEKLEE